MGLGRASISHQPRGYSRDLAAKNSGAKHSLQPRPPQNFLRIAGALDLNVGGLDLAQIVSGQGDGQRAEILFQTFELARPEQRHDPGLLSQ